MWPAAMRLRGAAVGLGGLRLSSADCAESSIAALGLHGLRSLLDTLQT